MKREKAEREEIEKAEREKAERERIEREKRGERYQEKLVPLWEKAKKSKGDERSTAVATIVAIHTIYEKGGNISDEKKVQFYAKGRANQEFFKKIANNTELLDGFLINKDVKGLVEKVNAETSKHFEMEKEEKKRQKEEEERKRKEGEEKKKEEERKKKEEERRRKEEAEKKPEPEEPEREQPEQEPEKRELGARMATSKRPPRSGSRASRRSSRGISATRARTN